jgi:hypothetical protein
VTGLTFCLQCGTQRHGSLRYCGSCGFDFWKAAGETAEGSSSSPASTPVASPPAAVENGIGPTGRPWLLWGGAAVAGLLVVGALATILGGTEPGVGSPGESNSQAASANPTATARPTVRPTPQPTVRPTPAGTSRAAIGQTVPIECGGDPCLDITVTERSEHSSYPGDYYADEPEQPGWVYMQVYVRYVSSKDASSYNQFDWAIYADGRQLDSYGFAINGPKPDLGSGTLPAGRTAEGWLLYEVPPTGEIVLSYEPNYDGPPIFEVVLRP